MLNAKEKEIAVESAYAKCQLFMEKLLSFISPGMNEKEAKETYMRLASESEIERNWHAPFIQFAWHTICSPGRPVAENLALQENDIYIVDMGPVFNSIEADYAMTVSTNPLYDPLVDATKKLWFETRELWLEKSATGNELYNFALKRAVEMGFHLDLGEDGHRIGPFPHDRSAPSDLRYLQETPVSGEWILELKLVDPNHNRGAFFEAPLLRSDIVKF